MRFGFVTCVQLGLACIEEIYACGGSLDLVVTLPDDLARRKSGRVFLDEFCGRHDIALIKSHDINEPEVTAAVRDRAIDWLFIIGWSQIARSPVLEAPRKGGIGAHPTLLPVGRGRAAIPWTILKGLTETGVTFFQLDEGVDTGPALHQERIPVSPDETATSLYRKVAEAHRLGMRSLWPQLAADNVVVIPQDESRATIWPGRTSDDGCITEEMTVADIERLVRATTHPYPGAFVVADGGRWRIWAGRRAGADDHAQGEGLRISRPDGVYIGTHVEWEADVG